MELKRVVVTGVGVYSPLGNDWATLWKNLCDGVSGAGPITYFNAEKFRTRFACHVHGFDADQCMGRKEARKLDRFAQLGFAAARQAVEHSKINENGVNKDRVGVIVASGIGGLRTFQEEVREFVLGDGTPRFNPFFIPKLISDIVSGYISMHYGYMGPNFSVVSACASSTNALIDAYNYIRLGMADVFVSGGSEAVISESGIGGFNAIRALSERNDEPQRASRPFDRDRDGFVMGEGAAILILEEYEHAKRRGANILAEIIGAGMSGDAYHLTAPHPEGKGAMMSMYGAIESAQIRKEDIDYINVHGTSTPIGDEAELRAIEGLFDQHAYELNISSSKSMTGHLLGAAGALEAIVCVLAVRNDCVPPTINLDNLDEKINSRLNLTPHKPQKRRVDIALTNTFGFGGHNATIIVRKPQ